jgi:hypothetical protein
MNFCKQTRPEIVKATPDMPFGQVGKELGARWAKLSQTEKDAFKSKDA